MLKDFLRRKEIVNRSIQIADEIINRYPPKMDTVLPGDDKADLKKKHRKLLRALEIGKMDIQRTINEMGLGVYGKAKFYQTIQETMRDKGYTEESTRVILEELVITL